MRSTSHRLVGRDETGRNGRGVTRLTGAVTAPLVIDSTETRSSRPAEAIWGQADHQFDQFRGW